MVLTTGLFDKPVFKSIIMNGLVLVRDRKNMSKGPNNYLDTNLVTNQYGVNSLHMYQINYPVMSA